MKLALLPQIVLITLNILHFFVLVESTYKINVPRLRCLVCEAMLNELQYAVSQLDPNINVDLGGYRIDNTGNAKRKQVPQTKSEMQLSDLADKVCDKMDDYIRATYKSNGELMLLKMLTAAGTMNSDFSNVDVIQDDDLNKSLKYYCEEILEDHETSIINHYINSSENISDQVCFQEAKLCEKPFKKDWVKTDL